MKKAVLFFMMLYFPSLSQASNLPVVSITNPENASTYFAGTVINITATALAAKGAISSVTFYKGSILLGQSIKSPYIYAWDPNTAGTFTLSAVATSSEGSSTTSNPVTVTIKPAPPVVDITSPANNTSFTAGSNVNLAASALEVNGTISEVSFYNGSTLLTTSSLTSSAYNYIWPDVPAGVYTLTAVATDINKVSTTSSPITINVTSSSAPFIAISSPTNNSIFTAGSNILIKAAISHSGGAVTEVYFYDGLDYLGSSTVSPYTYTWKNVTPGTYSLTAEATDSNGGTLISAPVNLIVNPPSNLLAPAVKGSLEPVISITSPANQSTITAGLNLTITVNASEAQGAIAKVYFYNGTNLIGMSSTPPYTYTWGNVPAGSCTLTAQAIDADGVSTASKPITVMVTGGNTVRH